MSVTLGIPTTTRRANTPDAPGVCIWGGFGVNVQIMPWAHPK